jgi:hypothetical protein
MELSSHFAKQARQFRIDFDEIARDIKHRGEAGSAREEALRVLLRGELLLSALASAGLDPVPQSQSVG